jgi:uncharacterized surface protein with fasciclin (FAS1) repeats
MSLTAIFPDVDAPLPSGSGLLSQQEDVAILGLALDAAGLTDAVRALDGATVFAPTDAAFVALAQDLGYDGDPEDDEAVFDAIATALASLSPDDDPIPLLRDILLYHVAPTTEEAAALDGSGPVTTLLDGATFQVTGGTVVDGDPDAENADIIEQDIPAGGVVIQLVDRVLLPIDTPIDNADPSLLDLVKESGGAADDNGEDFDLLLIALQATGLDTALDDPDAELTVFVPNDQAFISLAQDLGYEGEEEAGALATILEASAAADPEDPLGLVRGVLEIHVSPGAQTLSDITASDSIPTLSGIDLGVSEQGLVDADPDTPDAQIITPDIAASNGVAQGIDSVLLPIDLPQVDSTPDDTDEDAEGEEQDSREDDGFDIGDLGLAAGFALLLFLFL